MGMHKVWMVILLGLTSLAHAQQTPGGCADLGQVKLPGAALAVDNEGVVRLVQRALRPHGWSVTSNLPPEYGGPRLFGQLHAATWEQALQEIQRALQSARWSSSWQADRRSCTLHVTFDAQQAAAAAASVPAGTSAAPAALVLRAGQPLGAQLGAWLQNTGWMLLWRLDVDWLLANDVSLNTHDPLQVLDRIAQWLAQEGKAVQLTAYETNRVVVAQPTDAARVPAAQPSQ
ncbi:MAG: toxin co-regulated pilus biosynthesis Q family protein [Rhodocyclaceae bacterium]|nr:toxin co-regulated pilus biosynthesis Q family protein [Rhodocyclaceae bacterium]